MPTSKEARGQFRFEVDSGLLFQLGEELVARRSVALAELIKNAYDADATHVKLEFRNVSEPQGEIRLSDDGVGMTFERIRQAWMRIATPDKVRHPRSERYERPRAGAKGIGRFAARRLASRLVLISLAQVDSKAPGAGRERTAVVFHWDKFRRGQRIQDVPVRFRRTWIPGHGATGVKLRLRGVRDAWSEDDIRSLHSELLTLVSPTPPSVDGATRGDPGFQIEIEAREFPEYTGTLTDQFLKSAVAVLEGEVGKSGTVRYSVTFRGQPARSFRPPERRFSKIGDARFVVRFFVYRKDAFAGQLINVREARELGREQGGIRVYMDRFRVPPYGDPGDDWLNLDQDRAGRLDVVPVELRRFAKTERPMLLLPGNNQVFGQVFLSRFKNPHLHQTANRERLLENEAFEELRAFVRLGVNWLTVLYARRVAARDQPTDGRRNPLQLLERAEASLRRATDGMSEEKQTEILQAIQLAKTGIEEEREEHIGELSMLRVLASTGTMIVVFDHQLAGILEGLSQGYRDLQSLLGRISTVQRRRLSVVLDRLGGWIEDARHQAALLGLLLGRSARLRRRRLAVRPVVAAIELAFSRYMKDRGIAFRNEVPRGLRTPAMFECELSAILINLMTNTLKALRDARVREIRVSADRTEKVVSIRVEDTGIGADRRRWEEFFQPFVGESEPDPLLGTGTGLGLKIVRDFVDVYGGQARFIEPSPPWKTCVEIVLPE